MTNLLSVQKHHDDEEIFLTPQPSHIALSNAIPQKAQQQLGRMFRDPYILEKEERTELISDLRGAMAASPNTVELHVLLGMALCVDLQVQDAMEVLREAVILEPDNFLVHLKYGELLMRLRVCEQASDETRKASLLAANPIQSELARRQAATLRTMMREGIERGGYGGVLSRLTRLLSRRHRNNSTNEIAVVSQQ